MSIECFEGGAGTGKTHSLMSALEQRLQAFPLEEGQAVLALTFMHGSRHRLAERLRRIASIRGRHECLTIDSLAWRLVCRWRGLLAAAEPVNLAALDFEQRCEAAASALKRTGVREWVRRRYPVVVVDELQDVRGSRLSIIMALAAESHVIAAADGFQDLGSTGDNAAVTWMREVSRPTVLTRCHRTGCADLLNTASALRAGQAITDRQHCRILCAPNANVGASFVACNLTWYRIPGTVVLSPAGPASAPFVRDIIERLRRDSISPGALKGSAVGPFHIEWECHARVEAERLVEALSFEPECDTVDTTSIRVPLDRPGGRQLQEWINRQRRVLARSNIPRAEVEENANRICQQLRAMRQVRDDKLVAMTIHQAKNREFDKVIVLWPYQVSNNAETLRRLLYNAITRAKVRAAIIVQNASRNAGNRMKQPPFVAS